jgi:hypothetical protein
MFARVSATISTERFLGERRHYWKSTRPMPQPLMERAQDQGVAAARQEPLAEKRQQHPGDACRSLSDA